METQHITLGTLRSCAAALVLAQAVVAPWALPAAATAPTETQDPRAWRTITGIVVDDEGEPLTGVVVSAKNNPRQSAVTDVDGKFRIIVGSSCRELKFEYLGMDAAWLRLDADESDYTVTMQPKADQLNEVVVTGMFDRKASSFTGSATSFRKDDLQSVGTQNVLRSLSSLDPSFNFGDNLVMGSNPNAIPSIQLRGETSFNLQGDYDGNANQPLFILDGFEAPVEKVFDLDMNRVQSVTVLKDAAAKAIYGSKAGNGVVVIETVRPKSGELRVTYTGEADFQVPDLGSYDLMNAREKFDWEIAHRKYEKQTVYGAQNADNLYKQVYDAIVSGVDTYWLKIPTRTGIGQKHSLMFEGGDDKIRYLLGAAYNDIEGVMKGSGRQTFNIYSTLAYNYRNLAFRNQIDYTYNKGKDSPYGSFAQYVGLEPYFAPYDAFGNLKQVLGYQCAGEYYPVYNPLYNATLNIIDQDHYGSFTDNFEVDWTISHDFRLTASLSYMRRDFGSDLFYPASHTLFAEYNDNGMADRKGKYTKTSGVASSFSAKAGLNFNHQFGAHAIFANATYNLQMSQSNATTVVAEGFGNDRMNDISMGTYYEQNSHPAGTDYKQREIGIIGVVNYAYDSRYLLDASYRATGSSVYGSNNHWGGFWSVGLGWNVQNEPWMKNVHLVQRLKIRASIGYTGTQNFNPYQARATYCYGDIIYDGRLGATILGLPNNALRWQKVYDKNIGFDLMLGTFLTTRFDYFWQNTDNMLTDITLPPSAGFTTYKDNMGQIRNQGVEFTVGLTPWRDNSRRAWITFTASAYHNKNRVTRINDIFKKNNEEADKRLNGDAPGATETVSPDDMAAYRTQTTRPATKYYEGCSMTAIWGVRSLGIDPNTGREMFLDKNDNVTFNWNSDDQVVIGETTPKLRGTFGISAGWKGFTLNVLATYKFGGDIYNTTLIDRVENINGFGNLDKRVAYSWVRPGDVAPYKYVDMQAAPTEYANITRPTSRFVQRDNELFISTINVGYDFNNAPFLKALHLQRLRITFYANEIAHFSTVKVERGTDYPFARNFSLGLSATF